jgi:isopenicillin N synthase-like dioxygenase
LGLGLPDTDWMTEDGWHHLQIRKFPDGSPQPRADYGMLMISTEDTQALTVSPGGIMQFLTNGELRPRPPPPPGHTMVYFHEPSFDTGIRPFVAPPDSRFIHYGSHFTSTFIRDYPDRITTRRIIADGRLSILAGLARRASVEA